MAQWKWVDYGLLDRDEDDYVLWATMPAPDDAIVSVKLGCENLIAAAPEMLEALESVEWVTHTGSGGQRCPWCQGTYPDHKTDCMRQAVIAQARGE